jgi:hypothetical protein
MPDRRWHTTWWWFLIGWVWHGERRSGFDRRQRTADLPAINRTLLGLPIVIDDSVPPGHVEFRSGRRTVDIEINTKEEK